VGWLRRGALDGRGSAGVEQVVKDGASSTAQDLKHRAEGAHEQLCGYVKANPTASLLIALGAGAILGRLLR